MAEGEKEHCRESKARENEKVKRERERGKETEQRREKKWRGIGCMKNVCVCSSAFVG